MKRLALPFLLFSAPFLHSQTVLQILQPPTIVERRANERVWQSIRSVLDAAGQPELRTNSYVELATGICYEGENGAYLDADPTFEIFPEGVVARKTGHKVILSPNANTAGAVDVLMPGNGPGNRRLRSHVLSLSFFDVRSGQSVLIAQLKDSQAQLVLPQKNEVIYRDAFTDGVSASLRYRLTKAGIEQDILLERQLPVTPEDYNLDPAYTTLDVTSEFTEAPQPAIETDTITRHVPDRVVPTTNIVHRRIKFGEMEMGPGKAFKLEDGNESHSIDVERQWRQIDGRNVFFEAVPYSALKPLLDSLPPAVAGLSNQRRVERLASKSRVLPPAPVAKASSSPVLLAKAPQIPAAVVLDYILLSSSSDFIFRGDTTYHVTGDVYLSGSTTIIEGGTVVKFSSSSLIFQTPIQCQTAPYRPAFFLSKDDNSVGETIAGSTGSPSGYYAWRALSLQAYLDYSLKHLRIKNAFYGVYCNNSRPKYTEVSHSQISGCNYAFYLIDAEAKLRNNLIHNIESLVFSTWSVYQACTATCENGTLHKINALRLGSDSSWFYLYNCILASFTNSPSFAGNNNVIEPSGNGVFQTVGAGDHYLVAGSAHRNAGTTNITASLLADLRKRTTYPPLIQNSDFTLNTALSPVVQRDTDNIDLGWHYEPIDYAFSDRTVTGATLLLTNGVVIGLYSGEAGIKLAAGARLIAEGTPANPVRLIRYNSVQEQINTNWLFGSASVTFGDIATSGARPEARFRFTDFPLLATKFHYHFNGGSYMGPIVFHDCHLFGGELKQKFGSATPWTIAITNSILERAITTLGTGSDAVSVYAYNNLVRFGEFKLLAQTGNSWAVHDTLFDNVTLTQPYNTLANSHNGYLNTTRILPNSANDVILGSMSYSNGLLGSYYQSSSSLYNAGSRSATTAGLFHFTVKASQEKETNSVVDIGAHYPAWEDPATREYTEIPKANMTIDANESCFGWNEGYAINSSLLDPGWHNCSASGSWIRIKLWYGPYSVGRVKYHPRQGAGNGTFLSYRIYVTDSNSTNPADWGTEVANGSWTWPSGAETKTVDFTPKVGQYVVFRSMLAVGEPYASANELWVYQGISGPLKHDIDDDGRFDYAEDWDGDGGIDSGETDWQSAGDLGLKVRITQPKNNSILP